MQDLETQTIPPPRANFSEQVSKSISYDAYQEDYEAQQKEERKKKEKPAPGQKMEVKKKELKKTPDVDRALWSAKVLERMVNQNIFDEVAQGKQGIHL